MELWDIYNKDRQLTGKTKIRGSEFNVGEYHLVVHVAIFNKNQQMLIQHRQPFKSGWSNMWDISVGGSAVSGDDSATAAEREVFEELGLKIDLNGSRPVMTVHFSFGFDDIYIVNQEVDLETLSLQYEEVQAVKWATLDEIMEMIDAETFIPYHKSFIQMLFDMQSCNGVHGSVLRINETTKNEIEKNVTKGGVMV